MGRRGEMDGCKGVTRGRGGKAWREGGVERRGKREG